MEGRWHTASPSEIRELALQTALNYTGTHIDAYRNRDPEHLVQSDTILQGLWLSSGCHIDVRMNQLPSRSRLIPPSLSYLMTRLFYLSRNKRGPYFRKTDKGMGLGVFSKSWFKAERDKVLLDPIKYELMEHPADQTKINASKIYMMQKIHKERVPVPARVLVQGFCKIHLLLWLRSTQRA